MPRKTISFTNAHNDWLKAQVQSGQYTSDSEAIRDLIRERQKRESQVEFIRAALIEGENSGFSDRTPEEIMQGVIERKRENGTL
ncbi:type II toxin-antitoxin system ParD family antitoxin [Synechococcus sp. PCC 7336]|uniref:type II toxin-antitoxin system ParD family antitoxin n=1 Tax=Synechococcus sp. PCC 7336 TaxID=195250 RepID=UPI000346A727|nr:type II toxin-antitoxin system ParD family antitoxin [Synechococcus sp. PCC 7336]